MKKKLPILLTLILTLVLCVCGLFACGDSGDGNGESGSGENNQQQEVDWNLVYTVDGNEITGLTPYGKTLTQLVIPNAINGANITSIGEYAFKDRTLLTSITIGENIEKITSGAFAGCRKLTKVNYLGSIDSWVQIDFDDYKFAEPVDYDHANPLNKGADLYINGVKQTDITINAQSINAEAFYGYKALLSVTIGENVQSVGNEAFRWCTALRKVNYLGTIDGWVQIDFDGSLANPLCNGAELYMNNVKQTEITINAQTINANAFPRCISLTSVTIGNNVQSIGGSAFSDCTALSSVIIGSGVQSIGSSAFEDCDSLTSITIPNSVQSIGWGAFIDCTALKNIYFNDTSTWYRTSNYSDWQNKTGGTEISVTTSSTNATNFKSTYYNYYWYKK